MIEFDMDKDIENQRRRGLPFAAAFLFDGPFVEEEDVRGNYGESRFIATGPITLFGDRIFVVVYTWPNSSRRIISFRKANDREIRKYHTGVAG
ncbi:MAG TPA: BrnT family toxin [Sphingomonas sp.]|nr:BrnT family toxin [Sphingomonas sp.]